MGFTVVEFIILLISIALAIYLYGKQQCRRFVNSKIKFLKPLPVVGNTFKILTRQEHLNDLIGKSYSAFENERYVGFFNITNEFIILKDLDLIKQLTVKDFDFFVDHFSTTDPEADPLFYHNLFFLKGDRWRSMRSHLSPAFTGSKMKEMIPFMEKCASTLVKYVSKNVDNSAANGQPHFDLELKDLFSRYTNDVIASCAFGIESDSLNDQDNTFYKMSEDLTTVKGSALLKFAGFVIFPKLMKFFNFSIMSEKVSTFFKSTVHNIIDSREKSGYVRRDMIHLLMQAIKGSLVGEKESSASTDDVGFATVYEEISAKKLDKKNWTSDEIVAQVVIFLFAGFDTTSTLLSFLIYELTMCPEAREKLQAEIDEYVNDHNGEMVSYNDLHKLKYLDMVCTETLRLWPPVGALDRVCTKPYELPPSHDGHPGFQMKKGDKIFVPVSSIHMDAKYWKTPTKFIPERFSEENKSSIHPFAFMPFGVGPRSCIGNRFALMEVKLLVFHLLRNFDLVKTPKTDYPLKIISHVFSLTPANGFLIGMKKRDFTNTQDA